MSRKGYQQSSNYPQNNRPGSYGQQPPPQPQNDWASYFSQQQQQQQQSSQSAGNQAASQHQQQLYPQHPPQHQNQQQQQFTGSPSPYQPPLQAPPHRSQAAAGPAGHGNFGPPRGSSQQSSPYPIASNHSPQGPHPSSSPRPNIQNGPNAQYGKPPSGISYQSNSGSYGSAPPGNAPHQTYAHHSMQQSAPQEAYPHTGNRVGAFPQQPTFNAYPSSQPRPVFDPSAERQTTAPLSQRFVRVDEPIPSPFRPQHDQSSMPVIGRQQHQEVVYDQRFDAAPQSQARYTEAQYGARAGSKYVPPQMMGRANESQYPTDPALRMGLNQPPPYQQPPQQYGGVYPDGATQSRSAPVDYGQNFASRISPDPGMPVAAGPSGGFIHGPPPAIHRQHQHQQQHQQSSYEPPPFAAHRSAPQSYPPPMDMNAAHAVIDEIYGPAGMQARHVAPQISSIGQYYSAPPFNRPDIGNNASIAHGTGKPRGAVSSSYRFAPSSVVNKPSRGSRSPAPRRLRSRSPPENKKRLRDSRRDDVVYKRDRKSKSRSRSRSPSAKADRGVASKKVDLTLSARHLSIQFNTSILHERMLYYTPQDIMATFPRLYVPADFVKLEIDWQSCRDFINFGGDIFQISNPILHILENSPKALSDAIPLNQRVDKPPRGTHIEALLPDGRQCPIKFNVRVLVSLGYKHEDVKGDLLAALDFHLPRKIRLLCGKRKGSVALLGGAWCEELDGGNPLIDRSCLLNTACRTVRAAALCDVFRLGTFTKLFDINYHRPVETYEGKPFPEQEELTAVYICTLQQPNYTDEEYENEWEIFCQRCDGLKLGPRLSAVEDTTEERTSEDVNSVAADTISDAVITICPPEEDGFVDESTLDEPSESKTTSAQKNLESSYVNDCKPVRAHPGNQTVLLCPQPGYSEGDEKRFPDTTSLRILSLSAMLAYTLEDRNERLFEASLAAELLSSLISQAFAQVITDCLLSTSSQLALLSNPVIRAAIEYLLRVKTSKITISNTAVSETADVDVIEKCEEDSKQSVVTSDVNLSFEVYTDIGNETSESGELIVVEMKEDDEQALETESEVLNDLVGEANGEKTLNTFLAACRWFDTSSEGFLRAEHLKLIVGTANKHLSRADLSTVIDEMLLKLGEKTDRIMYETLYV